MNLSGVFAYLHFYCLKSVINLHNNYCTLKYTVNYIELDKPLLYPRVTKGGTTFNLKVHMTRISIDPIKNRLTLTLSGKFDISEAIETINLISREVNKMKPNFDVVTDLRFFKTVSLSAAKKIKEGTHLLQQYGMKRVVRVVGGSQLAVKVLARYSSLFDSNIEVYYVPTLEKADEILTTGVYK